MNEFVELKTTENQTIYVRKDSIGGFEVVNSSAHVEGHIKLFIGGFKFLVQGNKEDMLAKLSQGK